MNVLILNGSPRTDNTSDMIKAFKNGLSKKDYKINEIQVGKLKISGCLGCEYCHGKGEGKCIQRDDMDKVMQGYLDADMIVYASPIYYFGMTAQIVSAIQRVYAIGKPPKANKAVLLLTSGSEGVYTSAISMYKDMINYMGISDLGIITNSGMGKVSESKLSEIESFAENL